MNRITETFKNGSVYAAYLTAGDGGLQRTEECALALIAGGVNLLEIGVPFSDPVADGPVIAAASARAIEAGVDLDKIFELIARLRKKTDAPIVLFSYYNPILTYGNSFYAKAKSVGLDGCLIVDLPLEEGASHYQQCYDHNLDPILLISPSTSVERIKKINAAARGFLYYVSRKGITGTKSELPEDFRAQIEKIKSHIHLPIITGFGISNISSAKMALQQTNGFVIGSLFVDAIHQGLSTKLLTQLAQSLDPRKIPVLR